MVFPYIVITYWVFHVSFFRNQFSCIAIVILLEFFRLFQIILLLHFKIMFSSNGNEKVNCENFGTQTTRINLARHLHVLPAPTFWQRPEPKWIIKVPRNTLKQLLGLFINAKHVAKTFTAFAIHDSTSRRNMEHREVQLLKMLMSHN